MHKPVKWGILGLGRIAHKFAEGLKSVNNATLFAVGSRSFEKAEKFARQYKAVNKYGSYAELTNDPEIDIIYIATPHNLHYENTIMCLKKKKAVLCEKPFAMNSWQVKEMIDCAKENNVFLMEAMWTKFLPHINKTIEIILSGDIGKPKILFADFGFKPEFNPQGRLFNKKLGGGAILDIGIYPIFLSLLLFGKPEKITAIANFGKTDVDESCGIVFTYNDGKMAVLHTTIVSDTYTEAQIFGSKGSIKLCRMWFMPTNLIFKRNLGKPKPIRVKHINNGYNYEAEEATQCLLQGKKESDTMSHSFSLELINLLDKVRKECGIVYPEHDK